MIAMIAAMTKNRVIGRENKIPWPQKYSDLAYFKATTLNHTVIMGRKTFESMGTKPLKFRTNIVLSHNLNYQLALQTDHSIIVTDDIIKLINFYKNSKELIFVIGGNKVYNLFIDHAKYLYITIINKEFDGDCYFPDYLMHDCWELLSEKVHPNFVYYVYERN